MAYCEVEEVRAILIGERGQQQNVNANSLDDDQLMVAISDADTQIDAVLRNKYLIPFQILGVPTVEVPAIIHSLSMNIAVYNAYLIYRQDRAFDSQLSSPILRYSRAVDMLNKIDSGDVVLDIDTIGSADVGNTQTVFNQYDGPLFPSSNIFNAPEGYIPPDWVYR